MPLTAGTRLGPYEISAPLGAGGMGEVYRARDTRLERDVAVKLLPAEMAADQSRRQRFEHEAKAIAALNHPNIVAIYDTGEHEGLLYLVTELVDGASLRGASFPLRKTLDVAAQITDGLAAAHAAGITHRDLKPDNIMVTRQGRVKILDFGLAKVEGKAPRSEHDATMTAALTDPGTVMGTVGYMSPEQVRAQALDHRSDIFSFGLILYELLAGKRAFQRASAAETMTAIAQDDAPDLPDSVPAGLRLVVARCLEKDALHRFDSARDLGFALRTLSQAPSSSGPIAALPRAGPATRWVTWSAIAIGFLVVGILAGKRLWPAAEAPAWSGSLLGGPPMAHSPRLSPDGQMLGFLTIVDRQSQVGVMKPDSGNWRILTKNKANGPALTISWSPDGTRIYYDRLGARSMVYSVPVLGGEERLVLEGADTPEALPDGSLLFTRVNTDRRSQIHRFWPETGRLDALPAILGSRDVFGTGVRSFPGGDEALYVGMKMGDPDGRSFLSAVELTSGRIRRLWDQPVLYPGESALSISKDGKQVFMQLRAEGAYRIVAIPADGGSPRNLLNLFSISFFSDWGANGDLFLDLGNRPVEVIRFPPSGGRPELLSTSPAVSTYSTFLPLPDGRFLMPFPLGDRERLVVVTPGGAPQPFVDSQEHTSIPSTLVGDREVAFLIGPSEHPSIAIASVSDGRILQRLPPLDGSIRSLAASPDGKTLYYTLHGSVWAVPRTGGQPRKLRAGDFVSAHPSGGELLVQVNQHDRFRLIRFRLDGGPEREIPLQGKLQLTVVPLSPNAIAKDGRIVVVVSSADSWFWQVGIIHPDTGVITRVPLEVDGDIHYAGWTADGGIIAATKAFDAHIWRMRPIRP